MLVLIAPLDWGLGHATRCIPLIRALLRAGHTVVPCAGGAGARLLRAEFPDLTVEDLPGYAMTYTRNRAALPLWLLAQLPLYLIGACRGRWAARRLALKHRPGLIIADGRYGFRAAGVPSVFVTHQLEIKPPGPPVLRALVAPVLRLFNARALRAFTEIWVPDFPGTVNLSGHLGHPRHALFPGGGGPRVEYIRPLCRFRDSAAPWTARPAPGDHNHPEVSPHTAAMPVDILALVSGPEPQRTVFEDKLRAALKDMTGTRVLVRGKPGIQTSAPAAVVPGALTVFDHLSGDRLAHLLAQAHSVVCRSGYTTMMELAGVGAANVLLVATPGQPEQEYLARRAREGGYAMFQDQEELDLGGGLRWALALPGFEKLTSGVFGPDAGFTLDSWIASHHLLRP
jgi:hypothetical protein